MTTEAATASEAFHSLVLPDYAFADPHVAGALLTARCPGIRVTSAVRCDLGRRPLTALCVTISPPQQFLNLGYPVETACLILTPDSRVYPIGASITAGRPYKHRNLSGDLCLFYARDHTALTWLPTDGLEELLGITQRHLAYEEFCRRRGHWPVEDAPHGEPAKGTHPIRQSGTRRAASLWARPA